MSEHLTSFVSDVISIPLHSLIRNRQDFIGEFLIILSIAFSETCLHTIIFGGSEGGLTSFLV